VGCPGFLYFRTFSLQGSRGKYSLSPRFFVFQHPPSNSLKDRGGKEGCRLSRISYILS
jgi:hypothetical protein